MFLIEKEAPLTDDYICMALSKFQSGELPRLNKLKNYYDGKLSITYKKATDEGKPCNKVVVNYCYNIVENFNGYLTGKEITYNSEAEIDEILDVLNYNDSKSEDSDLLRNALIYGVGYEVNYMDPEGKQRFKTLESTECFPIYSNTLDEELLYVVRFWDEQRLDDEGRESYMVEVYSQYDVKRYKSSAGFAYINLIGETPHFFNQVPVTVMALNKDRKSIFEQIISLQDAYNTLLSSEVDDWESFCDSYLIIKGCQADEEQLSAMKSHRALMLDVDCDASYLTKDVNDSQINNMLQNVKDSIHSIACSPDFTDKDFMAQSGIAIKYKLVGFENKSSEIESELKKALQKRIELICSILNITNTDTDSSVEMWRDIDICISRNLPTDMAEIANIVNSLRGLVSNETLLTQIPFVDDVQKELEKVNKEKEESMELYADYSMEDPDMKNNNNKSNNKSNTNKDKEASK